VELGVDIKGKIALIKYGGLFRGLKVKNAQDHGAIGAVIFTDPGDDGNITVANGYKAYPGIFDPYDITGIMLTLILDGPARNPSSVQKGSTLFLSTRTGDPTTPGYPSKKDSPRADISEVIAKIPALPISYSAAEPLLKALNGHGVSAEKVNRTAWTGGLKVDYSSGPAPGVKLDLSTVSRDAIEPVHDVIGVINGTNADETIIIGNHRDTWMVVSQVVLLR
jgi:N-acetylated-alpha-linked acidic dipeptidase